LRSVNETNSADWNNLFGYCPRKKQPPDLAGAEKYYQAALKIDPDYRGALEYYGELKLMNNDLPGAEALLARLDKACFFWCEEYSDLKEVIQKYKSRKQGLSALALLISLLSSNEEEAACGCFYLSRSLYGLWIEFIHDKSKPAPNRLANSSR